MTGAPTCRLMGATGFRDPQVRHGTEVDDALATLVDPRPDALFVGDDGRVQAHLLPITAFATTHRLPSMGTRREAAEAGCLFAFGYNRRELAQRAAVYVGGR